MTDTPHAWTKLNIVIFSWFLFSFVYVHQRQFDDPTPVSRLDFLHALVRDGSFSIDRFHENTPDKAFYDNHYYSDKAPGTVAVCLMPFYLIIKVISWLGMDLDGESAWLLGSWGACAIGIAPITSLGAVAMFHWLKSMVDEASAWLTTVAIYLGGAPLPYTTMMFSHAMVIGLISIAIWCISQLKRPARTAVCETEKHSNKKLVSSDVLKNPAGRVGRYAVVYRLLAGFSLGLALASEFTSGLVVVVVLIWAGGRSVRAWSQLGAGAMLPLLLIPFYSVMTIGHPWTLPYSHQAVFLKMQDGLYAIEWPDLQTAFQLLFGPARGLFFWSPFLLMAFIGWYIGLRKASIQWMGLYYFLPLLQIVVISGRVWDWQAGFVLGPRYLSPILPLLALPCALAIQQFRKVGMGMVVLSVGITIVATCTDACPRYHLTNPFVELHLTSLMEGSFAYFFGAFWGLDSHAAFLIYLTVIVIGFLWIDSNIPSDCNESEGGQSP